MRARIEETPNGRFMAWYEDDRGYVLGKTRTFDTREQAKAWLNGDGDKQFGRK